MGSSHSFPLATNSMNAIEPLELSKVRNSAFRQKLELLGVERLSWEHNWSARKPKKILF